MIFVKEIYRGVDTVKISKLFGRTLRDDPHEAELISHRLMQRSGLIYQVASGIYSYMPLAWRSLRKIEKIIREEMDKAGGQELRMSVLQARELWQESGRDEDYGLEMFRVQDRRERDLVMAPTHEELLTVMVKSNVRSYRDLPLLLYQIQTKFRDEPRPRGGLLRVREFDMKDAYSFDINDEGLDQNYKIMEEAYKNIFARCGLDAVMVDADSGTIGGRDSQEFMLIADSGEDTLVICDNCKYAANAEKAVFSKSKISDEPEIPLEKVNTPGVRTIDDLTKFLKISADKTLKAVFYIAGGNVIVVTIRGDLDVNEIKVRNVLGGAPDFRLATPTEVKNAGLIPGSASPVGLEGIKIVADESATSISNFVAGANHDQFHLVNVNYGRDFKADVVTDIALVQDGDSCLNCGSILKIARGIEVGHIFKLGTRYSEKLGALFPDKDGQQKPIIMGCYGIGVGRLLAAAIEQNHDESGMLLPKSIAPYQVMILALNVDNEAVSQTAMGLYNDLWEAGIEVLYDDRDESAGGKFKDADLLGLPVRIVVSSRNLKENQVELKIRSDKDAIRIPLSSVLDNLKQILGH